MLLVILAAQTQARELAPSIGVHYSRLDLSSDSDTRSTLIGWSQEEYKVDLLWPVSQSVDLSFVGGKTVARVDSWDRRFTARTVVVNGSGQVISLNGTSQMSRHRDVLEGYNMAVSARFYFR